MDEDGLETALVSGPGAAPMAYRALQGEGYAAMVGKAESVVSIRSRFADSVDTDEVQFYGLDSIGPDLKAGPKTRFECAVVNLQEPHGFWNFDIWLEGDVVVACVGQFRPFRKAAIVATKPEPLDVSGAVSLSRGEEIRIEAAHGRGKVVFDVFPEQIETGDIRFVALNLTTLEVLATGSPEDIATEVDKHESWIHLDFV